MLSIGINGDLKNLLSKNLDWVVVLLTLQKLQSKYQTEQIYIQEIQNFRSAIKVSLYIAPELDFDDFAEVFWGKYESLLASKKKHNSPINSQILTTQT